MQSAPQIHEPLPQIGRDAHARILQVRGRVPRIETAAAAQRVCALRRAHTPAKRLDDRESKPRDALARRGDRGVNGPISLRTCGGVRWAWESHAVGSLT